MSSAVMPRNGLTLGAIDFRFHRFSDMQYPSDNLNTVIQGTGYTFFDSQHPSLSTRCFEYSNIRNLTSAFRIKRSVREEDHYLFPFTSILSLRSVYIHADGAETQDAGEGEEVM